MTHHDEVSVSRRNATSPGLPSGALYLLRCGRWPATNLPRETSDITTFLNETDFSITNVISGRNRKMESRSLKCGYIYGMFRKKQRNWSPFQSPRMELHPLDILLAHCQGHDPGTKLFLEMAYDWMEMGSAHVSVGEALRHPLNLNEQSLVGTAVKNLMGQLEANEAVKRAGMLGLSMFPLVPNTFRREMLTAVDQAKSGGQAQDHTDSEDRAYEAIVNVTAESFVSLMHAGRTEQAVTAAMMGGTLFMRARAWCEARGTT